ncbi:MAG: DUF4198 domain-containing protein [Fuerstiella sp.]|nr:DUF4198 domain-containing protein [Fuerstiella sp.]
MIRNCLILLLASASSALAHDTWVETNTNLIRTGDAVYVDLKLGNHGNDHRDFKLASKVGLKGSTLRMLSPEGKSYDLKSELVDTGYAPKEGYWTTKFVPAQPGLYMVAHTMDQVVSYAPVRSVKSAKTFFVVSPTLDRVSPDNPGFNRLLGHPFELVPVTSPVTPMGPGQPITVQLFYKGKPMANARVSFIPRGHQLKEEFDPDYERKTDAKGHAVFTPTTGNTYLVVAHHKEPDESGDNHESTKYSTTLTVFVPEICPCCGE